MSLFVTLALASTPALPTPVQDDELFSLYIGKAENFFADPKDAGVLGAMRLLQDRVLELPGEVPDFPVLTPELVSMAAKILTGEKSLRIGMNSDPAAMFPIYGQLEMMEGDAAAATELAQLLTGLGRMGGVPFGPAREDGLLPIQAGAPMDIAFGSRGDQVLISAGKTLDTIIDLSGTGLPEGAVPTIMMNMDLGAIMEAVQMMMAEEMSPDEADEYNMMMEDMGLAHMVLNMASGVDSERSHTVVRMPGYADWLFDAGLMPGRTLSSQDLAIVPADAVWASISCSNVQGTIDYTLGMMEDAMAEQGMGDPLQMVAAMTGFHLTEDFTDHLGTVAGMYASDSTGGGGLMSTVFFVELSNAAAITETMGRLEEIVNGIAAAEMDGYMRTRNWQAEGAEFTSLTFPGLPVPLEPTIGVTRTHMFVAVSPSGALAAVQEAGSAGGLGDNPRFRENLGGAVEGSYGVSFFDSPRLLKEGYWLTSMLTSALVNATRSRFDPERDAGVIMPTFNQLKGGAKASVSLQGAEGSDWVMRGQADRSMLVNLTSGVGFLSSSPLLMAIPAVLGWVSLQSREVMTLDGIDIEDF